MLAWLEEGAFESYSKEEPILGAYRLFQSGQATEVLTAGDVMSTSLVTASPQTSVVEAHRILQKHEIQHLPVVDKGVLVGLVSDRDVFSAEQREEATVDAIMAQKLLTARATSALWAVAEIMVSHHINCVLVVDSERRLDGLLTSLDILSCMTHQAPVEVWL